MTTTTPRMGPIRNKLTAAAAAAALLTTAGIASASAASASAAPPRTSGAALQTALHRDLTRYLAARGVRTRMSHHPGRPIPSSRISWARATSVILVGK